MRPLALALLLAGCGSSPNSPGHGDLSWPVDDSGMRADLAHLGGAVDMGSAKPDLAPAPPACDFDAVTASGTLTLDLKTATVSGEVKLNGAQLPDNSLGTGDRASLRFVDRKSGNSITVGLGATGAGSYTLKLFAGTYDIILDGGASQNALPSSSTLLATGVALSGAVTQNFNVATVTVSGSFTLDGAQLADNTLGTGARGSITFVDNVSHGTTNATLGTTGAAAYTATLFAGSYDVQLAPGSSQNALPAQSAVLQRGLAITTTTTQNFNLATAKLSGSITINGVQMPDNSLGAGNRANVLITDPQSGGSQSVAITATGAATYSFTTYAGSYDVRLVAGSSQNAIPTQSALLQKGVSVSGTVMKSYNLTTATLSGAVTVNGAAMADNSLGAGARGTLELVDTQSGNNISTTLSASGAASYTIAFFTGTYDVRLIGGSSQDALPTLTTTLQKALALNATTTKTFDASVITLSGALTLNGVQVPDNTLGAGARGALVFVSRDSLSSTSSTLSASGAANYSAKLFAGTYDVDLDGGSSQNALPVQSTVLVRAIALNASASRAFDAKTSTLSGTVTVDGAQMADNALGASARGSLRFADVFGAGAITTTLGATGAAAFSVTLFDGSYDVFADAGSSQNAIPVESTQLKTGCISDASCTSSSADVSGNWSVTTTAPYSWTMTLAQSGSTLTGTFQDSLGYSGPLSDGTRNGNAVHFQIATNCQLPVDGIVTSGCLMRGSLNCGYLFTWVGIRE